MPTLNSHDRCWEIITAQSEGKGWPTLLLLSYLVISQPCAHLSYSQPVRCMRLLSYPWPRAKLYWEKNFTRICRWLKQLSKEQTIENVTLNVISVSAQMKRFLSHLPHPPKVCPFLGMKPVFPTPSSSAFEIAPLHRAECPWRTLYQCRVPQSVALRADLGLCVRPGLLDRMVFSTAKYSVYCLPFLY